MTGAYYLDATIARMLANPRSAEVRLYCDRRFLDKTVSRAEAWQIGEALAWLEVSK